MRDRLSKTFTEHAGKAIAVIFSGEDRLRATVQNLQTEVGYIMSMPIAGSIVMRQRTEPPARNALRGQNNDFTLRKPLPQPAFAFFWLTTRHFRLRVTHQPDAVTLGQRGIDQPLMTTMQRGELPHHQPTGETCHRATSALRHWYRPCHALHQKRDTTRQSAKDRAPHKAVRQWC